MTDSPVPLVLDLWSLGHSASDISRRLGVPGGHKAVTRIVEQARRIGDPRAKVLHCGQNGRLLGRPGRDGTTIRRGAKTVKHKEVAMLVPKFAETCKRGHPRTDDNLAGDGRTCLKCRKLTDRSRYSAIKGLS